jgi:hypothetical protein
MAQPEIQIPKELDIRVNKNLFSPSPGWIDTLLDQSEKLAVKYRIVSTVRSDIRVTTKVRIPQVLTLPAVLQQIVLYYALLGDEASRRREILLIYPYFESLADEPAIRCSYTGSGAYQVTAGGWHTIPAPAEPGPEEKFIHNRVIEKALEDPDVFDDIPIEIFNEVARENNRTTEEIIAIYEKIQLWQMANR